MNMLESSTTEESKLESLDYQLVALEQSPFILYECCTARDHWQGSLMTTRLSHGLQFTDHPSGR